MKETTHEKLKNIKQSFRLLMNGEVSRSMKEKGVEYKINWGVPLPELQQMAAPYGKDYDLAIALWKEDIRECKIMASIIMPPEQMSPKLADTWITQIHSLEIAEITSFCLFQYLEHAPALAYQWIASDNDMQQLCGYLTLSRIFMNREPNERGINEFLDHTMTILQGDNNTIKHAAINCLRRLVNLGNDYETMTRQAMTAMHLDNYLEIL